MDLFEMRWSKLMEDYPIVEKYMNETLYSTKESWAIPWVRKQFTAVYKVHKELNL